MTVRIVEEFDRWREGNNVHTRHYVKLADAIEGCNISVPTIQGQVDFNIPSLSAVSYFTLPGKAQEGDHKVQTVLQIPRHTDEKMRELSEKLTQAASDDNFSRSRLRYDAEVPIYG